MNKKAIEKVLREAAGAQKDIQYCHENKISDSSELSGKKVRYEKIKHAIDRLPYYQKVIIFEFYIKGRTWAAISMQLGRSESHCRALRDLAIRELMGLFAEFGII